MSINQSSKNTEIESGFNSYDRDPIAAFCQNTIAEARLRKYQLEQHEADLESLKQKVQNLELYNATQIGQDKIIGFMVGAIVLSLLSLVTTFFFKLPTAPVQASNHVAQVVHPTFDDISAM